MSVFIIKTIGCLYHASRARSKGEEGGYDFLPVRGHVYLSIMISLVFDLSGGEVAG